MRRGLTLVEMLVSLVCVILLMLAYTQLFAEVGTRINDARAAIDVTNRLRSAAQRLRWDLQGVTAEMLPWQRPESGAGGFEIIEGPLSDPHADSGFTYRHNGAPNDLFPYGDTDDVLMFTIRSKSGPSVGKFNGQPTQSEVAEVVWFLRPTLQSDPAGANPALAALPTSPLTFSLYRRLFLVLPTVNGNPVRIPLASLTDRNGDSQKTLEDLYYTHDLSARIEGSDIVANNLSDLTKRENRFAHFYMQDVNTANGFPHRVQPNRILPFGGRFNGGNYEVDTAHPRYGEDVVLTNILAFDVQVWDSTAEVRFDAGSTVALEPHDPGYLAAPPAVVAKGAYVDLNYAGDPAKSSFSGPGVSGGGPGTELIAAVPNPSSVRLLNTWLFYPLTDTTNYKQPATYDTGSFHYEHDGLDQDDDGIVDEGTNGFDDDSANGVDDPGERETSPPYPVPLRGIKVRIRVYEPDTRQIREVSVTYSFVPE